MKRTYLLGSVLAAAVLAAGGFGIDTALSGPTAAPAAGTTSTSTPGVQIGATALAPGTALVDGSGRALYLFEADMGSTSSCTGVCAQVWPPLLTRGAAPVASGAAQAQQFGSTSRADGTQQVTYNGHPLYYFTGDKNPGETRGQGLDRFGGPWYVVTPAGDKIDPDDADEPAAGPAAAPAPSAAAGPSVAAGGYGY
jgi:predicted lipoprotein with Yx(FWY)xxD motif